MFDRTFLQNVIFVREEGYPSASLGLAILQMLDSWNSLATFAVADTETLPSGPYYVRHGLLHAVSRVFADVQEAFMTATVPPMDKSERCESKPRISSVADNGS